MADKVPYVDQSLVDYLGKSITRHDFDIAGDAEEQMRALAYRQGQLDFLAKIQNLVKRGGK